MVGCRIKQLRVQRGYSINELSEKAGISKSYLSYIERGIQKNPSLQVLSRLANTLEIKLEDLLEQRKGVELSKWENIDDEWASIIQEAIQQGVSKKEFSYYLDFIKFKKKMEENS